jgi:hypothetical protein
LRKREIELRKEGKLIEKRGEVNCTKSENEVRKDGK